jgi:diacylglycerol kinase (ATP)
MNPYVIVNPVAGSAARERTLRAQLERLDPVRIRLTRKRGDAKIFAEEAIRVGARYIVCAGGDGTLNEVVNGIGARPKNVSIGIVPLGTGNDFARVLGLPRRTSDAIEILLKRKTRPIDLVRVRAERTRFFVNVSAGGFSGLVDEKLTPQMKRTWGPLSYIRSAAAALPQLHGYKTRVRIDDDEELSLELYNVIIGNGRFVAGGLPIAPKADPADGLLDVVLIPKRSMAETVVIAAQIVLGKHLSKRRAVFRRGKKVSVRSKPGMWFNVDGELVGNAPVVFQIIPAALNFVVSTWEK